MDRDDATKHLDHLRSVKYLSVKSYRHMCKLFEYLLYEIDALKDREAIAPSVYGSYADEPNYTEYEGWTAEAQPELPEVEIEEPDPVISESCEYVDATTVPLVMAYQASLIPFPEPTPEPEETRESEAPKEEPKADTNKQGDEAPSEQSSPPRKEKPKRLRFNVEKDKNDLHAQGLKRVKEALRRAKTEPEAKKEQS